MTEDEGRIFVAYTEVAMVHVVHIKYIMLRFRVPIALSRLCASC